MKFTKEHCNAIKESWKNRIDYRGPSYCKVCGTRNKRSRNICCSRRCAAKLNEGVKRPDTVRRKISEKIKMNWKDETKRKRYLEVIKLSHNTETCKVKLSDNMKKNWKEPTIRKKMIEGLIRVNKTGKVIENRSKAQKEAWVKLNHEQRVERTTPGNIVRTQNAQKINVSTIEKMVYKELDFLNIQYSTQKWIGKWCVDVYVPSKRLIIECNGDYWHNLLERRNRDNELEKWANNHNYKIIWLWENKIRKDCKGVLIKSLMAKGVIHSD